MTKIKAGVSWGTILALNSSSNEAKSQGGRHNTEVAFVLLTQQPRGVSKNFSEFLMLLRLIDGTS